MKRKTITIDRDIYARLDAARRPGETFAAAIDRLASVKTNADALAFYQRKTDWLASRKIALIERLRRQKRPSLRA